MKKKLLISTMLMSAAVAAGTPMISNAACGGSAQPYTGRSCKVYTYQDMKTLKQMMNGLCGNSGKACGSANSCTPNVQCPVLPGGQEPVIPEDGAPSVPDISVPDIEKPGTGDTAGDITTQNGYAEQIAALVNAERAKAGLPELTLQAEITDAANVRAAEIRRQFSHTRPDGRSFSTALSDNGISFRGSGENIAYGQQSPESVMEGWMNSSGHRANILNANYKNIGIGHYQDESGVNYWVQLFTY